MISQASVIVTTIASAAAVVLLNYLGLDDVHAFEDDDLRNMTGDL